MKISAITALSLAALCTPSMAQNDPRDTYKQEQASLDAAPPPPRGSLYLQKAQPTAADIASAAADGQPVNHSMSFTEVPAAQKKQYRKHDIVTIVVSEESESTTTGTSTSNKKQTFDTALQQFVKLASTSAGFPSVQSSSNPGTLPEVKFSNDNERSNDASQDRKDELTYRIAATIVDIKPNGTLVLEATKQIQNDKEVQTFRLTGICKSESIKNDNVQSTDIAELSVSKATKGEVHDGIRSGWLNSAIDKFNPF